VQLLEEGLFKMEIQREDLNYILQEAQIEKLEKLYKKIDKKLGITILSNPSSQTLLVPVKDPISGGEFYAGEVLVTSTIVEINKNKGWSMVQDENEQLSLYIATLDAVFENEEFKDDIIKLCKKTNKKMQERKNILNKKVNSTRVSFDLMEG
jgi:alpha-D-ribose 1-methylphosphonate 5-triphosphate synthase subunit PhnG|tara:strand:- start:43747 stop:44202 length:456 start_codon:yes stop_codon:yes gene_type:complete